MLLRTQIMAFWLVDFTGLGLQSNLSTTATLETEESERCGEVAVMGR